MNIEPKYQVLSSWMMSGLGIFVPALREFKEIAHQYDREYVSDSSKFERRFLDFKPTSSLHALRLSVDGLRFFVLCSLFKEVRYRRSLLIIS